MDPEAQMADDVVCVGASKWQVAAMAVVPSLIVGGFAATLILGGEGWARFAGFGLVALAVWLSFWSQRRTEGLRVVVDDESARITDREGRSRSLACARWEDVATGGLELRSTPDSRPRLVLVLKDRAGTDLFQLSPDLCSPGDARIVVQAIRRRMDSLDLPFSASIHWPCRPPGAEAR